MDTANERIRAIHLNAWLFHTDLLAGNVWKPRQYIKRSNTRKPQAELQGASHDNKLTYSDSDAMQIRVVCQLRISCARRLTLPSPQRDHGATWRT
jgi:hypothetical protein